MTLCLLRTAQAVGYLMPRSYPSGQCPSAQEFCDGHFPNEQDGADFSTTLALNVEKSFFMLSAPHSGHVGAASAIRLAKCVNL